jgi:hypothetical protein
MDLVTMRPEVAGFLFWLLILAGCFGGMAVFYLLQALERWWLRRRERARGREG